MVSGVDLKLGDRCSACAYQWAQKTFHIREDGLGKPVGTGGASFASLSDYNHMHIALSSDGIGTKAEIAERTKTYHTVGWDLVAMVADDLAANGLIPINITNILDVNHLEYDTVDQLMRGLHDACVFTRMTVTGGEIAELGNRIGGYGDGMHFNWCATATGILPQGKSVIAGQDITVGDTLVSIQSNGFRSNGYTLARNVLAKKFGDQWHTKENAYGSAWGEELLKPSKIYSPLITALRNKNISMTGIAHITGGGIPSKLGRVLRTKGLGASIEKLHNPHESMLDLIKMAQIKPEIAYRQWNMGNGMIIICKKIHRDDIVTISREMGYHAIVSGYITEDKNITIKYSDKELVYNV